MSVAVRLATETDLVAVRFIGFATWPGSFYRSQGFVELETPTSPLDPVWLRLGQDTPRP